MSVTDDIHRELAALLEEKGTLLSLLDKLESNRIVEFGTAYQLWFTRASRECQEFCVMRTG